MKYGKFSSKKKRKPLYENTSKNLEYNNQKKLQKAMDSYLNDYKRMSKKLGIKNPEEIIFSETDIEDSIYNIDLMVNKWGDYYDLTPSYNPQIEEYNLYNPTNIIFQSKNPIIKKDYNLRIQKIYPSKEPNNEQFNLKSVKKNINESIKKNNNEQKEEDIIGEEEEYKFDDNDKNYNEEEEYKFDDNDKNYNEENKNNNDNIEEEYYFEDEEVDKKDGPKLNKKEEEIFYYEDEEVDNKDGPKLNYNNNNNNYNNNNSNDEIEENIEGKKLPELNDLIKEDSVKLPQLNDILKSDNKDNIQVIPNKKIINNEKNEEIEDEIFEEEIPNQKKEKIEKNKKNEKNEISEIKKSNTTNLKEKVEIKKSNTSNLNKENLINSEIKKSKTSNLNNYHNNLKKENKKKENNFNPNETIYETMQRVDKKTKIITKALNKNLIQNLNKRQKICSDWDSNNKNLIFIYIEKINNNKKDVESLLVRIYSLKKKKTNYKIISIRLLHHMGVFNSDKIDRIKIKNYSKEIFKAVEKIISNK